MKHNADLLSGAYRTKPDGASDVTIEVITAFADSKHYALLGHNQ